MLAKHLLKRAGTIPPERVDDVYRRLAMRYHADEQQQHARSISLARPTSMR
jgi:hypothetical protein